MNLKLERAACCSMASVPVAACGKVETNTYHRTWSWKRNLDGRPAQSQCACIYLCLVRLAKYSSPRAQVFTQISSVRSLVQEVHLVDSSLAMQSLQKARLQPLAEEYNWTMEWRDSIDNIPRDPSKFTMLVAHEFFDALPFHLLEVTARYYHWIYCSGY